MNNILQKSGLFLLCAFIPASLIGCSENAKSVNSENYIMNTYISQTVYGKNAERASENVNDILEELENGFSMYIENSDIDRINKNAGIEPVKVSDYTFNLLKIAAEYSSKSNGVFDITVAPLTKLWAIDSASPHIPTEQELETALSLIDYSKIVFDDEKNTVFLASENMEIDLGGVAKGYFIEKIGEEYKKSGVTSALCSIGGNIATFGKKPDGNPFVLGIRDPLGETGNDIVGTLLSTDETVATTGGYERFFEQNGVKYHHVFDLKTGMPCNNSLLSVTVIAKDGGLADFLSTTLFLSDIDIVKSCLSDTRFSVIAIDKEKNIYCSDSIRNRFTLTSGEYRIATP